MKYSFIALIIIVTGCASGPSYKDAKAQMTAIPQDKARITLFRTTESKLFIGRKAPIQLNGVNIGGVGYGSFVSKDLKAGEHVLRTELWDSPGACEIGFSIRDLGKEYFFEVQPRDKANEAFQKGSSIFFPVITGMAALSRESKNNPCGGLFSIAPVTEADAKKKLLSGQ